MASININIPYLNSNEEDCLDPEEIVFFETIKDEGLKTLIETGMSKQIVIYLWTKKEEATKDVEKKKKKCCDVSSQQGYCDKAFDELSRAVTRMEVFKRHLAEKELLVYL